MIIKLAGEQKSNDSWGLENYFVSETSNSFSDSAKENIGDFSPKRESKLMISGYLAKRSWCLENQQTIRYLQSFSNLYMHDTRFWEYPFVFTNIKGRSQSKIIDIGCGQGTFAKILSMQGHRVIGVDNYESCWKDMENDLTKTGLRFVNSDARDLKEFSDGEFDIALLISVIEHIPSNTIYCEKNRAPKTAAMLAAENPAKLAVISEALRVLKPNGLLIMTSDLYLDYPMDMNISWHELLGLEGLDIKDVSDTRDLFISDNPIHKGRIMPVGIIIEKQESTEVSSFIMIDGFLAQGGEYFFLGDLIKSKKCYQNVLNRDPNHLITLNNMGVISLQEGNHDEAILYFQKVLQLDENNLDAIGNTAKVLEAKGNFLDALNLYNKVFHKTGGNTAVLNAIGHCFFELDDLKTARLVYHESLKIDNNQDDVKSLLKSINNVPDVS